MKLHFALLPAVWLLAAPVSAQSPRGFDVRDMVKLDRYSAPLLSADGRRVVFAKSVLDTDQSKRSTSLWVGDVGSANTPAVRLTPQGWNVSSPAFSPDGDTVYFLSTHAGASQLYAVPAAGGTPIRLTDFPLDVEAFKLAPDGRRAAFAFAVFPDCRGDLACSKDKLEAEKARKSSGVLYDRLFVRHWDAWADGRLNRIFVAPLNDGRLARTAALVSGDVHGDIPSKPFGDLSDLAWAPDGKSIVFSARLSDRTEPWSTNFDLYQVAADGRGKARNLTAANRAWDAGPVFSADGRTLYYRAMRRPGFEADRFALMAMDLASGQTRELAPGWDRSAEGIVLSVDGKRLYTTAQDTGEHPLFSVEIDSGKVDKRVGEGSVSAFALAGQTLLFARNRLDGGDRLFLADADGNHARAFTPSASQMLPDVRWGEYEQFRFKGWNDDTVYGYVVKPWNYRPGGKYPVAFLIHGGPQGSFGNGWSYRWNPQTYAGQGYAVVMIDFHGSTGYGQAFTDAISRHWGDRPLEDLQKGWQAALAKYDFLDGDKACALGASYGGFMVNWIAGRWNQPWKCLVNHDGVFDQRAMGYVTEELWFTEWEQGGTPYDVPENYEKFNPVNHVAQWRVPMLVVQGERDYRVPVDQALAAFTALQRRGIDSKLLYFPDENHWVLKPQNSILWHDTVNAWLKHHIGG